MLTYGIFHLEGLGDVGIVSSEEGVYRIYLRMANKNQILKKLKGKTGLEIREDSQKNAPFFKQIQAYWKGIKKEFDIPLDWSVISSPFAIQILKTLQTVPFGETVSYQELGERAGYPKAARAVGGVMSRNPFPIVIPCHRVLRKNGSLGGYTGGIDIKKKLLKAEGVI